MKILCQYYLLITPLMTTVAKCDPSWPSAAPRPQLSSRLVKRASKWLEMMLPYGHHIPLSAILHMVHFRAMTAIQILGSHLVGLLLRAYRPYSRYNYPRLIHRNCRENCFPEPSNTRPISLAKLRSNID